EMADGMRITTVEMHTGGEPLRVVTSGLPEIRGKTLLDKRRYIRENLDHIRKFLMFEPRGHYDMYGVYLVEPDEPGADLACIFIHNEGYSTMCGHAVLALGRYAVDKGIVRNPTAPSTRVVIQCPCGPVEAHVEYTEGGQTGAVAFNSVPAFLRGSRRARYRRGYDILRPSLQLSHPDSPDLAFLYGTIVTDGNDIFSDKETANVCVFAEREVDRSPCGSGVTARIAQQYFRSLIKLDQSREFRGPAGSKFKARAIKEVRYGPHDAVVVEVSGKGHYSGECTFTLEDDDHIGKGFLLK
ncbi:T3HPD-like protein, partial [Mya arenaria]